MRQPARTTPAGPGPGASLTASVLRQKLGVSGELLEFSWAKRSDRTVSVTHLVMHLVYLPPCLVVI